MKRVTHGIFSKLAIGACAIILQFVWLIMIMYAASERFSEMNVIFHIISVILALYLVNRNIKPYNKLSWIFIILWMPIIGVTCYFLLGRSELTRGNRRRLSEVIRHTEKYVTQDPAIVEQLKTDNYEAYKQSRYLTDYAGYPLCHEEDTEYFSCGEKVFERLLEDLKSAENFIFLEFFIIEPGYMFDTIVDILEQKAAEGVKIRLIYDDVGCINTLPSKYYRRLQKKGIRCASFNPFRPFLSVVMNNRDHRKVVVIDGRIAYTGGFNLADEYINRVKRFGYWKDAGIRITGEGVWNFTVMFMQMWNYIVRGDEPCDPYRMSYDDKQKEESTGMIQPYADSPLDHENVGETVYLNIINRARKYVYIFTPYLIIDSEMSTALINAAKSGVDVRIVTPGIPDKKLVYLLTQSYYEQLIRGGVRIFQYTPGFIHSKCFVSDDEYAVVGTVNLDYRSLYLHFECGVWMYRAKAVAGVKEDALRAFDECQEISLEFCTQRNFIVRLIQSVLLLFAPLL